MAKKSTKKEVSVNEEQKVQEHLDEIKKDLEDLKEKLGMTKRSDLTRLPLEAARKIGDTASEIVKTASDVVEKSLKVVQFAALGAIEGGKKALKEETKRGKKKSV